MARRLYRLGLAIAHHKWAVILLWLALLVLVVTLYHTAGSNTSNNLDLPGTDSQAASDLLADQFPPQQNGKNPIVFRAVNGKVTDAANKQAIEQSYENFKKQPLPQQQPQQPGKEPQSPMAALTAGDQRDD